MSLSSDYRIETVPQYDYNARQKSLSEVY